MEVQDIKILEAFESEKPDFNFEEMIYEVLSKLTKKDLFGLGRIELVGYSKNPNEGEEISLFYPKEKGERAYIELCIYKIIDQMPEEQKKNADHFEPHLAYALLRGVGYNTLQFKHGVSQKKAETIAVGYARSQFRTLYPDWEIKDGVPHKS